MGHGHGFREYSCTKIIFCTTLLIIELGVYKSNILYRFSGCGFRVHKTVRPGTDERWRWSVFPRGGLCGAGWFEEQCLAGSGLGGRAAAQGDSSGSRGVMQ
ncbi:hypothetical protein PCL1606_11240 [Pseudomonas chlororaphis]|uniref:Uncharacterized protein n=1 Tax=Pseudomonas chlororaphis TaxID=587753 RepID=A0A0D5XUR6_9PSED|nr:hypothetical protein PCL1606_11240 [Pseudomonas chlororaphis]